MEKKKEQPSWFSVLFSLTNWPKLKHIYFIVF